MFSALFFGACSVPERGSVRHVASRTGSVTNSFDVAKNSRAKLDGNWTGDSEIVTELKDGIEAQKYAGHPDYNPSVAYVVDPSKQEMTIYNLDSWAPVLTIPVGTGKRGLGFGGAQTPIGFFTMGGVRIAKNANAYIQTGDSKTGVSGVYAEILYPPSHKKASLRGRVPNNVIIHGFNPRASSMLRDRHEKKMIGRIPCTTGCPVPGMNDLPKLAPYLKQSAGKFDPTARPNSALRSLIRRKQVVEYSSKNQLGDPILILNCPFRG
ncbi:MAG: L,D-transpeptidase [Verrucomicrobiales bacterium]|nr:L,D-transpeptidase [Verrucomicrobiales bacterium]